MFADGRNVLFQAEGTNVLQWENLSFDTEETYDFTRKEARFENF